MNKNEISDEQRWQRVLARDSKADGQFVSAVTSTKIYCRPSCPAKHPLRKNVRFYASPSEAEQAGFRACKRCRPTEPNSQAEQVRALCDYIEKNLDSSLTLEALSQQVHLSPYHLQRTFKKIVGVSPKQYAAQLRTKRLRTNLKAGETVTTSVYEAGFGSSSRVYEKNTLGMPPGVYRRGGNGMLIGYTIVNSPLGRMIVAATNRGLCFVGFGTDDKHLESELHKDYPAAEIKHDRSFNRWVDSMLDTLKGESPRQELPLDVRGTAFQQQVWNALQHIPAGQTRTYGQIAKQIGKPSAARAVGRACATNHVPIIIPCHRAIGSNGKLTGFRWGLSRKEKLLAQESEEK
jgi:AraC family transcriptional regulator, regulatory protein of adaptative response / methylated-DNA-[protein]-cysteine methyltransferase